MTHLKWKNRVGYILWRLLHVEGASVAIYPDMYGELGRLGALQGGGKSKPNHKLSNFEAGSWDGKQLPDPLKRCPVEQGDFERPTSRTAQLDEA